MSEDALPHPPPEQDRFAAKALISVNRWLGSRSGFGAICDNETMRGPTWNTIFSSSFLLRSDPLSFAEPNVFDHEFPRDSWSYMVRYAAPRLFRHLANPKCFEPTPIWALFWAMAKAEHQFIERFLPFGSHEERLTGHFVNLLVERTLESQHDWDSLSVQTVPSRRPSLRVLYADTAAHNQEKLTGADFAIIIHSRMPDREEYFKVARLQAKKCNQHGGAAIDQEQLTRMLATGGAGQYIFYPRFTRTDWTPPPTVVSAESCNKVLERIREGKQKNQDWFKEDAVSTYNIRRHESVDFASWMTFCLADARGHCGRLVNTVQEAIATACSGPTPDGPPGPPRRLLIFTLGDGDGGPPPDWIGPLGDFIHIQTKE